jgi:hypothetical protein
MNTSTFNRHRPRKRAIQYSETSVTEPKRRGVLDTPLEPVIGLAGGETRWRGMTFFARHRRKNLAERSLGRRDCPCGVASFPPNAN